MTTLCDLAAKLPVLVGALLDRETKLKKGRFREETLTDVVTAALATFAGPSMVIEYPDEAATGGDLDLDFWQVSTGRRLRLRIQAKRLNATENNKKTISIKNRAYNELLHVVPSTGAYQFKTLLNSAGPCLPLYMFYNHASVVQDAYFAGAIPRVCGINLAFAYDIAFELEAKLTAKPKRLHHKRLSHLRTHFFDLATILCPPVAPGDDVPSPDAVANALQRVWLGGVDEAKRSDHDYLVRWLSARESLLPDRESYRRIEDGPPIRFNPRLRRPTITFLSGRTDDDRTPKISDQDPPA
ncbi:MULTISPECIES: DUF6615 family protein [Rhizobium]|uniref:DUF6615 family protein n=1 Tax=Rhizobium TaxID=379 RepID=UPI0007F0DEF5|nr:MULTISPECIES: DUF6615 family protein [Rhizobium]ANK90549.1 hypothetical protein AMK01_CH01040 [Rhizobium sp. N6212]ANK96577.1 hypothetical protein AMK00_CH01041 [Rhizobium sp. N621]ANL02621.1 hypothetical protein AMJ99_CH01033 [Rhizobium esperanzae]ANL08749.1 hypothetical protein AMJ98_CH01033 [Rhizobium sp. N1341]ANL20796.1 hypothetical protein AMJ96_CH01035 [Rhizobium sp. N113]